MRKEVAIREKETSAGYHRTKMQKEIVYHEIIDIFKI